jgi:hypothetical protein
VTAAPTQPDLSVIVVPLGGGSHLVRCLEALRGQKDLPATEIILPMDERVPETDAESLMVLFPELRPVRLPGRRTYAELRAAGVKAARGRLIAITEDQCIPPARWCANIVAAHQKPAAAIGGPVDKAEPDSPINWSIYLRELGTYMTPVEEGPSPSLTDCNVTYKREALEAIAGVWAAEFHEPGVHQALARNGPLWLSPALVTYQQREIHVVDAIRERYEFGRLYGSLRAAQLSLAGRLLLIAASPLLPLVLVARVLRGVLRKGRYIGACFRALPWMVLWAGIWSWGELLGYATRRATPRGTAAASSALRQ